MNAAATHPAEMHALIVADGDPPDLHMIDVTWPGWRTGIGLIVAADGGARSALTAGLRPDLVVGDGDSLGDEGTAAVEAAGIRVERAPVDKDESDTELAVCACLARGATSISIVGAFGGRLDHTLANIALLGLPDIGERPVQLLDGRTRVRLIRAPGPNGEVASLRCDGRPGDLVSLLPLGERVEGITTEGLQYPLADEPLVLGPARGLSNVRLGATALVTVRRGRLLVVESPATLST
jgi:thiamine pyrophosphokinase